MKKIDIGQTVGIVANIGVIAGILLLAFELNQNRDMMRAQTRNEISRSAMDLLVSGSTSEQLARVMAKANADADLSPEENFMWLNRAELVFRLWENINYQYRQGMFDATEYSGNLATINDVLSRNRSLVDYWCAREQMFSRPFAEEMATLSITQSC